jgi:hypothetical protein
VFFEGSRYEEVGTHEIVDARGRTMQYKKVRFIGPASQRWTHAVSQEERLDHIAHRYYLDAERFWRICDANEVLWPGEALEPLGRLLRIPPVQE